jgi:hypothetical protein
MAFVVILNQSLTFRKSWEEGRKKCYLLGGAEYLASALEREYEVSSGFWSKFMFV